MPDNGIYRRHDRVQIIHESTRIEWGSSELFARKQIRNSPGFVIALSDTRWRHMMSAAAGVGKKAALSVTVHIVSTAAVTAYPGQHIFRTTVRRVS